MERFVFHGYCVRLTNSISKTIVVDTLHTQTMSAIVNNSDSCTRREFVVATGLLFAGTTISCSSNNEQKPTTEHPVEHNILALPDDSPVIRVRVGKIRGRNNVSIGETQVTRSNDKWYTSGNRPIHRRTANAIVFDSVTNCKVTEGNTVKEISGTVELFSRNDLSSYAFDVVATIPIELYLPGVLAGELYSHWHPATFAAQAIAARSYAVAHHLQRVEVSHYDVSDDESSQMFLGEVSLDVAHRAVRETEGIVLSWNKTVVPAYYSACCGGTAARAIDAISGSNQHNILPLFGHDGIDACTTLDIHTWTARRDSRTLRKQLNACSTLLKLPELITIHSIRSVEPSATNAHGRPTRLAIVDRRRRVTEMRARDFVRAVQTPISSMPNPTEKIWSSFLTGKKSGLDIQFEGYGMGHGVGLCQYGAQEFAGRGKSFEEILSWYYPQATLHTIPTITTHTMA